MKVFKRAYKNIVLKTWHTLEYLCGMNEVVIEIENWLWHRRTQLWHKLDDLRRKVKNKHRELKREEYRVEEDPGPSSLIIQFADMIYDEAPSMPRSSIRPFITVKHKEVE